MGIMRKAEEALTGHPQQSARSTNHGPHEAMGGAAARDAGLGTTVPQTTTTTSHGGFGSTAPQTTTTTTSHVAPRVDPFESGQTRHNDRFGGAYETPGTSSTNTGPHSSNLANKLDPRVDSDMDNRARHEALAGSSYNNPAVGNNHGATVGTTPRTTAGTTTGAPTGATVGPHSSNLANKLDPRVDSDMDNRARHQGLAGSSYNNPTVGTTHGATVGTTPRTTAGTTPRTTAVGTTTGATVGPHRSNLANKLDPRVDSDLGNRTTGTQRGAF